MWINKHTGRSANTVGQQIVFCRALKFRRPQVGMFPLVTVGTGGVTGFVSGRTLVDHVPLSVCIPDEQQADRTFPFPAADCLQ